ncbi:MAG TPA: hypothetical protein VH593_05805 [Ktedonobacteraceae bacterium]
MLVVEAEPLLLEALLGLLRAEGYIYFGVDSLEEVLPKVKTTIYPKISGSSD